MRMTRLFTQTLRSAPADARSDGARLLVRAGFIRRARAQDGQGEWVVLPLGIRALGRIEDRVRAELAALGGQEIRFEAAEGGDPRESMAALIRNEIRSHRQLPAVLFNVFPLAADFALPGEAHRLPGHPAYWALSLSPDDEDAERQAEAIRAAFARVLGDCRLESVVTEGPETADGREWVFGSPGDGESFLSCAGCGYRANRSVAAIARPTSEPEEPRPLEKVATPGAATIESLANFMGVPGARTAKAVFFTAPGGARGSESRRFVLAVIRGDLDVNEHKLRALLGVRSLRPAEESEVRDAGAEPGYGSAVGLRDVLVVADDSIASSPNLVAGANETGYHLVNVNLGRDFRASRIADIALARPGDGCPRCGAGLREEPGTELAAVGLKLPDGDAGFAYLDAQGKSRPVRSAVHRLSVGRLLVCMAETCCDKDGLLWPDAGAPFHVHLVGMNLDEADVRHEAETLYGKLVADGIEVLFDDRAESPGVKFKDADLIGVPVRITVSRRSLAAGGAEMRRRESREATLVPCGEATAAARRALGLDAGPRSVSAGASRAHTKRTRAWT